MFKNKRRGKIRVSLECVEQKELMAALFSEFTPVIASIDFNAVEYSGFSDHFKEVPEGESPRTYEATINCLEERGMKKYSVTFSEVKF